MKAVLFLLMAAAASVLLAQPGDALATGTNVITILDQGVSGSSLQLDSLGRPVISYQTEAPTLDLKLIHCGNVNCTAGNSISTVDTGGSINQSVLALDASGNPVIAYHEFGGGDLKLLHCDDPNCVGGGESYTTPDTTDDVGDFLDMVLDAVGRPVISYHNETTGDLKLLHCDDVNCAGSEISRTLDSTGDVGEDTSVVLDGVNPVISYLDASNVTLKVLHCADPGCSAIKSTHTVTSGEGAGSSLVLDASGNPVVSYIGSSFDLKILHCNDRHCAPGGDSIVAVDTEGSVGFDSSLVLDASGNPVMSYLETIPNFDLKVAHCGNADCSNGNVLARPDSVADTGFGSSLALDSEGFPVIAYTEGVLPGFLKLIHCGTATCSKAAVGGIAELPDTDFTAPLNTSDPMGNIGGVFAGIVAVALIGAAAWYTGRRWLRS